VFLLGVFDPATSEQVQAFAALLDDSDAMVRARGLDAVKQFAPADQIAAIPRLGSLLDAKREERTENRMTVARMCGALKRDASPALPALKQTAAGDPDVKVRAAALGALAQVAEPIEAANTLAAGLSDKDVAVRIVAAARLRQLGPAAAVAAQPLAAALGDSSQEVTEAAAEALIRIGAPSAAPLGDQLKSTSVTTRKLAMACLVKLGPMAKPAMERIEKCKSDTDPEVRKLAEVALSRILAK
jgi:HEAT repeat protein